MSNLCDQFTQLELDLAIVHEVTHGGPTTTVETDGGALPTVAKVLADANARFSVLQEKYEDFLHSMQSVLIKTFHFEKALTWRVQHGFETVSFTQTMRDIDGIPLFAHVEIVDENEFVVQFTSPEAGAITVVFDKMRESVSPHCN